MNDPEYSLRYPTKMQARYRYRYKQPASFLRDEHRRIVTEQNGRSETRKYLNAQIDHYNLRWRATERLMEQRTAILVGAVTATLIAVNAARQMTPVERTGIWLFDSGAALLQ